MATKKKMSLHGPLEPLILVVRNQRVILDADLASLYEVPTKRFNEAFKRNRRRFPVDFAFRLTTAEFNNLRSQIATSSLQQVESTRNHLGWSQIVTTSHADGDISHGPLPSTARSWPRTSSAASGQFR